MKGIVDKRSGLAKALGGGPVPVRVLDGLGGRLAEGAEVGQQAGVGRVEGLGHHPHVGDDRHEVQVAAPAGHEVHVEVLGDARTRGGAEVDPDVHPLGVHRDAQGRRGGAHELEEVGVLGLGELAQVAGVPGGDHHHVRRREGVLVQHHEGVGAAAEHQALAPAGDVLGDVAAEDAAVLLGPADVLHPPGGPEPGARVRGVGHDGRGVWCARAARRKGDRAGGGCKPGAGFDVLPA